jgi:hypothetical protein
MDAESLVRRVSLGGVCRGGQPGRSLAPVDFMTALEVRVRGEYEEMPGLHLTLPQAARLFGLTVGVAQAVLDGLCQAAVLARSELGRYSLSCAVHTDERRREHRNGDSTMARDSRAGLPVSRSLRNATLDRLACLLRHWTWADEARIRFEQELSRGWEYDEDPLADHPFGSYYHWCALLCGLSEAAVEQGLLSALQLDAIRHDLEASLPALRACRQLLVVIPESLEDHPRVVELLRDEETLGRLRRVHEAFGEALREERAAREIETLDP